MKQRYSEETVELITQALRAWHQIKPEGLLSNWLLCKQNAQHHSASTDLAAQRLQTNEVLLNALNKLEQQTPKYAKVLRLRFLDQEVEDKAAQALKVSVPTMYRHQRKAIDTLTKILVAFEQALYAQAVETQRKALPSASYKQLFGITQQHQALLDELFSPTSIGFYLVCGIGGIGKTSLIHSIVTQLIQDLQYDRIVWVKVTHRNMSGRGRANAVKQVLDKLTSCAKPPSPSENILRQWFEQKPTLLIVDNVEDPDEAFAVWQRFQEWTSTSKIVLTSRARPASLSKVHITRLDALAEADCYPFMRHLAKTANQNDLATADDAQLRPIYERTGGNPYAIEMVMGLAATRPVQTILDDLPKAQRDDTKQLYDHIYDRVWRSLTKNAQRLFKFMPLAGARGATPAHIQSVIDLEDEPFWQAIDELQARSLLFQVGTTFAPRYGIHRLSEQFLKKK